LTDSLKFGLDILFIGINPGLQSSLKNHHFAGPTNAFWPALCESGLVNEKLTFEDDVKLLKEYNYGFTNLVERPSRSISDLSRKEIMLGVPVLKQKISKYRPKIACFLGKQIFECFSGKKKFELGLQLEPITHDFDNLEDKFTKSIVLSDYTKTYLFVTPSTSGRSARFSRQQKIDYFVNVK
ncbi:DNA glycosylase, partial [Neoconidiobolus thromboides FSU 785]